MLAESVDKLAVTKGFATKVNNFEELIELMRRTKVVEREKKKTEKLEELKKDKEMERGGGGRRSIDMTGNLIF